MRRRTVAAALVLAVAVAGAAEARPRASMVRDITPGPGGSHPSELTPFRGGVVFGIASHLLGESLWQSDGTWRGTRELRGGVQPRELTAAGAHLLFSGTDAGGGELWKTDGTPQGTTVVKDIHPGAGSSYPQGLTAMGDTVFFSADDGTHGPELWKSDGTEAGTVLVKDIRPGAEHWSWIAEMTPVGSTLYFTADDGVTHWGLWKSDGTEAGTVLLWPGDTAGCVPRDLTAVGTTLFFTCRYQLWKTDGTPGGSVLVKDFTATLGEGLDTDEFDYEPSQLTAVGARLYFSAYTGAHSWELWSSDGTAAGTRLVKDIARGTAGSRPVSLAAVGGRLLFAADNGRGVAVWRSDGTATGTRRVARGPRGVPVADITAAGGAAFFAAGNGLWRAPASGGDATLVRHFALVWQGPWADAGGRLFLSADDGSHGAELWRTR